jgi:hypothetical protein
MGGVNEWLADRFKLDLSQAKLPISIGGVTRLSLAGWCAELRFRRIVEVGVRRADYTTVLAAANPRARIIGVDPWAIYDGYLIGATRDNTTEHIEGHYARACARAERFPNIRYIRSFSVEAAAEFKPDSIDMVYIDGNHAAEYVTADIDAWTRVVRPGGIISGHDYKRMVMRNERYEVFQAVNAYTAAHEIRPWFVLGSRKSHPGVPRDSERSWMWVKQ